MRRPYWVLLLLIGVAMAFALGCKTAPAPAPAPTTAAPPAPAVQPTTAPAPAAQPTTAAPAAAKESPAPKNAKGTIVFGMSDLGCNPGVNTVFCNQYEVQVWGVGEDLFNWRWKDAAKGVIDYANPQLAVKFDLAPDGKSVVIETRTGVKFHKKGGDWGEMTAEDIAWSYNQVNPKVTSHSIAPSAAYYASLFGDNLAKALDANHVEFKFTIVDTHWNTYQMNGNGFVGYVTHSKKAYDAKGEDWSKDNMVATGPFQVDSWARNDRAVFSKFDEHWKEKPLIEKVIIQAVPQDSTRVAALQTGEMDAAVLALKSVPTLLQQGFVNVSTANAVQEGLIFSGNLWEEKHPITGEDLGAAKSPVYVRDLEWLGNPWNPKDGNNPEGIDDMEQARLVRWAVAMAIDRNSINAKFLNNLGWPVHIGYSDEKSPYWQKKWEYPYDVAKANEFLDKAGYKKGSSGIRFEMPLFVDSGHAAGLGDEIMDSVGGMMSGIGIKSEILKFPYAVFRPGLVGRTATIPRITSGDDGQSIFPYDWPKGQEESALSRGGYCICYEAPKATEVFLKVAAELDEQKRIAYTNEYFDYMYHWALKPGIVAIPTLVTYNPKSIKEWAMEPNGFSTAGSFERIVPAR